MCIYHSCTYRGMFSSGVADYQWDLEPPNESRFVVLYCFFNFKNTFNAVEH